MSGVVTGTAATARTRKQRLAEIGGLLRNPSQLWIWTGVFTLVATALTVSRRPDSVFHAQFWAEDGHNWFAEAYNWGWLPATFTPHTGYFQTISRLTADLSLLVDFSLAPLVFNGIALIIQVLPAVFLVSPRFQRLIPDFRVRLLLALIYIGIPNSYELDANITNAMTHLAFLAGLIILAEPSRRRAWRVFDIFWVVLSGLSGPFVIALAPVAILRWITDRRSRWRLILMSLVLGCAAIQAAAVVATGAATRPHPSLGATPHGFMAIITGNVFAGALIGQHYYDLLFQQPWWEAHTLAVRVTFFVGVAAVVYAVTRGPIEIGLLVLFAGIALLGSLLSPVLTLVGDQWPLLAHPGAANRYFLLPMIAFLACVAWVALRSRLTALRISAIIVLLATIFVGIPGDWRYTPYDNFQPEYYATVFNIAKPGTRVVIPINPPGWAIELTKK